MTTQSFAFALLIASLIPLGQMTGMIIPVYVYPSDLTQAPWADILNAQSKNPTVPIYSIINPNNGPGETCDPNYLKVTETLKNTLGYVYSKWGSRPIDEVIKDIQLYQSCYPLLTGIFVDEMASEPGHESYYSELLNSINGFSVGNPGTNADTYIGIFDVTNVWENPNVSNPSDIHSFPSDELSIMIYDVPESYVYSDAMTELRKKVGYIYASDAGNSYTSITSYLQNAAAYFASEKKTIRRCSKIRSLKN